MSKQTIIEQGKKVKKELRGLRVLTVDEMQKEIRALLRQCRRRKKEADKKWKAQGKLNIKGAYQYGISDTLLDVIDKLNYIIK